MAAPGWLRPFTRTPCIYPFVINNLKHFARKRVVLCSCPNQSAAITVVFVQWRGFFPLPGGGSLTKEHSEKKVIGYSMDQMYDIVADVDNYKKFVPFCTGSDVFQRSENHARANLEVGFQFVKERYTSVLTLARPNLVKSECMDGTLFTHLTCVWKFSKGPLNIPNSCTLNFYISFEFKSVLHSQLATVFFEQVVVKMVEAFLSRARELHGPSTLEGGVGTKGHGVHGYVSQGQVPHDRSDNAQPQRRGQMPAPRITPRKKTRRVITIPKD